MATKEVRPELLAPGSQPPLNLKPIERFLRLLTWQMFFLLAVLFYIAFRPQAGRYQVILGKDEIVVFDTSSLRVVPIKPQQIKEAAGDDKTTLNTPNASVNPQPATESK